MSPLDTVAAAGLRIPVLCIDTCSLLDIIRDPTRGDARPHARQAAIDLAGRLERGDLLCLVADQVALEFAVHDAAIQSEAATAIRKLRESVDRANAIHGLFHRQVPVSLGHLDAQVAPARAVVQRWLDRALATPASADALARALARVNQNVAPARQGKDSVKDCVVLETYLAAVDDLRAAGMASTVVFLSSNTSEYVAAGGTLKPALAPDFARTAMGYAANMAAAKIQLGF